MKTGTREPSRLPVRGTLGLLGTVGALALLLSFRGAPSMGEAVVADVDEAEATDELITGAVTATNDDAAAEPFTLTGDRVTSRWGDVQVAVTVDGSDVIDVQMLALPDGDSRSAQISDYVGPALREEAITYDTADVSVISGATYTSEAYARSLQAALDQVGADTTVPDEAVVLADEPEPGTAGNAPLTLTGDRVTTRWGDVQVAVTVDGDDIIDVETLRIPDRDGRSRRINRYAEPILREEAIAADTSDVSVVSGATYTSRAYATSLQSALDQLGI